MDDSLDGITHSLPLVPSGESGHFSRAKSGHFSRAKSGAFSRTKLGDFSRAKKHYPDPVLPCSGRIPWRIIRYPASAGYKKSISGSGDAENPFRPNSKFYYVGLVSNNYLKSPKHNTQSNGKYRLANYCLPIGI